MQTASLGTVFLLISATRLSDCKSWHRAVTFVVDPGKEDCYYMPNITLGQNIEVEFQVINTGSQTGEMDLTVRLLDPSLQLLQSFDKASDGTYSEEATQDGDHLVCLDNSYSTFSGKNVYVEMSVEDGSTGEDAEYVYEEDEYIDSGEMHSMQQADLDSVQDDFHMSVQEIKERLQKIRANVVKSRQDQDQVYVLHAKDYHQAVNTLSKVNLWSVLQLAMIVATGVMQVVVVRGLFDSNHTFGALASKLTSR